MSGHDLGSLSSKRSGDDAVALETRSFEPPRRRKSDTTAEASDMLMRFEQDQLAREYADIERASAALRLGEPDLRSWHRPAPPAARKPEPLWLLIGVLWISTAIVTAGAVAAIATLAG
jgi:hypothetical protein